MSKRRSLRRRVLLALMGSLLLPLAGHAQDAGAPEKSKLEKAKGQMNLKSLAKELTKGDSEEAPAGDPSKATSEAESTLNEMTVSVGAGALVEEMP